MSLKILSLEASTEACSAALLHQDVIQECYQLAPRQHTHLILPMLESLLAEATLKLCDLDAIAFSRGPGSFTGNRISASIVQAIAFAMDIPVVSISSLQCLAQGAYRELHATQVLAAMDARMNEIYWASYRLGDEGIMLEYDPEQLSDPKQFPGTALSDFIGVGSGWDHYAELLEPQFKENQLQQCYPGRYPRAYDVALLAAHAYKEGQVVSAEQAVPVYLREKVASPKCS
ncbi:peptidase M22 glycoprotease [Candidatus Rickettsiella viridis]|uniref:tRNA threonylcarbamoyladenosine biosynthesis protein TsaB n=1 Tax=Candidatus Rickettsiella viridis TaxID=676208 RepID=A0A2Z5UUN6_9COXI|nr:tRNA (adenosine(37)-N6)-threonylcarbamoyltransferase complex dimerization subunit type 1 TsaB [Candidatus Rickettsiella viridis]BBB15208.1 peptidase M22 glycoprotease [Candidatus Rickettsiella viridis]